MFFYFDKLDHCFLKLLNFLDILSRPDFLHTRSTSCGEGTLIFVPLSWDEITGLIRQLIFRNLAKAESVPRDFPSLCLCLYFIY